MENEQEIFRAWLYKIVKQDKIITGRELSAQVGIKEPTLSAYHSGRVIYGERKFPVVPFEIRKAILKITKTSYEDMLEAGRQELQPKVTPLTGEDIKNLIHGEVDKRFDAVTTAPQNDLEKRKTLKNQPHHDLVDKFRNPELAYELNEKIYEIEGLSAESLEELNDFLDTKLKRLRKNKPQEDQKKTSNGK